MPAPELLYTPVPQLAALLRARKLSPVELVRACLDRIEAVNPKVNAFLTVTAEAALARAGCARKRHQAGC